MLHIVYKTNIGSILTRGLDDRWRLAVATFPDGVTGACSGRVVYSQLALPVRNSLF
jgi:hypothetical protein